MKIVDSLPDNALPMFQKVHTSAVKEYHDPDKRKGSNNASNEEVAIRLPGQP